jgi:arylformamidase
MNNWIDISVPLSHSLVAWPGDPRFELRRIVEIGPEAPCNLSAFSMCAHNGTHVDAPLHFLAGGASMDEIPFDALNGAARVISINDPERIPISELEPCQIEPGERILFKTRNSRRRWHNAPFDTRFVAIPAETARYLASCKPALVGIDYLSVGAFEGDGVETHCLLLAAGIWLLEGIDLYEINPGKYELQCLPLKIEGAEGAPARAVLRRI